MRLSASVGFSVFSDDGPGDEGCSHCIKDKDRMNAGIRKIVDGMFIDRKPVWNGFQNDSIREL